MWFVSRVRILLGALLTYPLSPVFLLVGGGFCVFGHAVVSGRFRWFPAPYVVEMHGRFSPLKRRKDPHPRGVRVNLYVLCDFFRGGYGLSRVWVVQMQLPNMVHRNPVATFELVDALP